MDWNSDNSFCDGPENERIFRFRESSATVVRMSPNHKRPLVSVIEGKEDWESWFRKNHPTPDGSESGLVLILARRAGEGELGHRGEVEFDDWLKKLKKLASMDCREQSSSNILGKGDGRLKNLPIPRETFSTIVQKFYIHRSMARHISRADIPALSSFQLRMGDKKEGIKRQAIVYTCRTSNAWGGDLALSATHFPSCKLTFAMVFGCRLSIEISILERLGNSQCEAYHPLLLPGIFVELERQRHINIVESTIDELETRIENLDSDPEAVGAMSRQEKTKAYREKRSVWLDTMYMKNQLISWNSHLLEMSRHTDKLNNTLFTTSWRNKLPLNLYLSTKAGPIEKTNRSWKLGSESETFIEARLCSSHSSKFFITPLDNSWHRYPPTGDGFNLGIPCSAEYSESLQLPGYFVFSQSLNEKTMPSSEDLVDSMHQTGVKIKDRIQDIIHEYNEKIRDCTMRVEGMAMANQWAQGETNVEIALATSRDSRHMSSIALVTMIFLPGTFFASIFSMTFFDWSDSSDGKVVSRYFWIYVLMTVILTLTTLGLWWYFGVHLHSKKAYHAKRSSEDLV